MENKILYNEIDSNKKLSLLELKQIINLLSDEELKKEVMLVQLFENFEPRLIPVSQIMIDNKTLTIVDFAVRSKITQKTNSKK